MRSDPNDPEDQESEPPRGKIVPFPTRRSTPDWLTRPGDELQSEDAPEAGDLPRETLEPPLPRPVLTRPGAAPPARERSRWAGPFSDMARAPVASPQGAAPAAPEPATPEDDEPLDDPGRKDDPGGLGAAPGRWAPAGSSVPVIRVPLPADPAPSARSRGERITSAVPVPAPGSVPVLAPATPVPPLEEPFWLVALDAVRSSRLLTVLAAAGLLGALALGWWLFPRGVGLTPLSRLRHDPARFDGASITVRGRVGDDVFTVGSGWAFYLTQGRDTVVAFARTRRPRPHESIKLHGQVSTGFLDGIARQALFETPDSNR